MPMLRLRGLLWTGWLMCSAGSRGLGTFDAVGSSCCIFIARQASSTLVVATATLIKVVTDAFGARKGAISMHGWKGGVYFTLLDVV
jgi:hypothetical protein